MQERRRPLTIHVSTGEGVGSTRLAAFDAALQQAGAADLNLIPLSSIIPPIATIVEGPLPSRSAGFGDRLYCVLASQTTSESKDRASAAIGWVQAVDGRGLFAEAHGNDPEEVAAIVRATLIDMTGRRSEQKWGEIHISQATTDRCDGTPVAAVAIAAYGTAQWEPSW